MTGDPNDKNTNGAEPSGEKALQKVELDLDDAPFLDDEPEPEAKDEPEPEATEAAPPVEEEAPRKKAPGALLVQRLRANKKQLALAGGGAVILALVAFAVNMFLFSAPEEQPPPPTETVTVRPQTSPPAETPRHIMQFEPFWVELKDTEGAIRFLNCRFSVPTENATLFAEMNIKVLILRDALFYYLRNQPILSLSDEFRVQAFKADLMTVINEHLGSGKISEILIQDYIIR